MPTVDSPLVAFGLAKPSFQFEIVSRQFIDRSQEQPGQKTRHQARQVPNERVRLPREVLAEFLKGAATVLLGSLGRIERVGNGLELLHLRP